MEKVVGILLIIVLVDHLLEMVVERVVMVEIRYMVIMVEVVVLVDILVKVVGVDIMVLLLEPTVLAVAVAVVQDGQLESHKVLEEVELEYMDKVLMV